jgi:hypothetical protein
MVKVLAGYKVSMENMDQLLRVDLKSQSYEQNGI